MILRPVAPPVEYGITKRLARAGNAAIAFLRSLGTSAHVWLPGANGVSVASLPSNNYLLSDGSTGYSTVDGVDGLVKDAMDPVTGINLTQPTTANKPLVRRGMLNLMFQSQTLTVAPWANAGTSPTITADAGLSASGTMTADRVQFPAANSIRYLNSTLVVGQPYTLAVTVKSFAGSADTFRLTANDFVSNSSNFTATASYTTFVLNFSATSSSPIAAGIRSDSVNTASDLLVDSIGIFNGTWTAAQILAEGGIPTTTATAASNPSAGKYWWSFDGSNDSLLSGNLGITNACTIVIAGRVNSLAATQMLLAETTNGVQLFLATDGTYYFYKEGVAMLVASAAGAVTAGVPFVLTARLSGGTAVIRLNGVQVATAATAYTLAATTGMRIGTNFAGTLYPLNGALGWVVPLPVALSDADCLTVERLVGSQFPGMATF